MKVYSKSIKNNYLIDQCGSRGTQFLKNKKPNYSFHLAWEELPANTKSLALICVDHDAIPACGFTWVHWIVANIDPALKELPENASQTMDLLEGVTSWNSPLVSKDWWLDKEDATGYGGCAPPDQEHRYDIELYALDKKLDLTRGFYQNQLLKAMENHVLAKASIFGLYRPKD